jgi:hypothetical protein
VVPCKPMWQSMQPCQISPTVPALMLVMNSCLCLHSILSAIILKLNVSEYMLLRIVFLVLVCGTRAQSLSAPFSYTLYMSKAESYGPDSLQVWRTSVLTTKIFDLILYYISIFSLIFSRFIRFLPEILNGHNNCYKTQLLYSYVDFL